MLSNGINNNRFKISLLSGGGGQAIGIATNIIYVPFALEQLGSEAFGMWMVVMSVVMYLGISQFGIGPATAALIAKTGDPVKQNAILSESLRYLCIASLVLVALTGFAAVSPATWIGIFGRGGQADASAAVLAVVIMAFFYALRLPSSVFPAAFIGMQAVHWERLYSAILPPVTALLALLLTRYVDGGIVMLALLTGVGQFVVGVVAGIHLVIQYPHLRFSVLNWLEKKTNDISLLSSGGRFWVISLAALVVWGTDNILISYFIGPDAVTPYAVTFKLFSAAYAIFLIVNSALWPMFGRAVGEGDWVWVATTYNKATVLLPILGGLVWIGGVLFAEPIINMWTGSAGYGGALVVFALGGYGYALSLINTHATLLGGINETHGMVWVGIAEAMANLVFSMILLNWLGIGGVALGTFLAALFTAFWLLPMVIRNRTQNNVRMSWRSVYKNLFVLMPCLLLAVIMRRQDVDFSYYVLGFFLIAIYLSVSWHVVDVQLRKGLLSAIK